MTTKRIELKIALELETDDAEIVDITIGEPTAFDVGSEVIAEGVPAPVARMIEEFAPPALAPFQMDFANRCIAELGLDVQPPSSDRKYVNAYPPKRYGPKRAAVFDNKTGRAEIYCRPENAEGREHAEVVENNGVPFAVRVYLRSPAAVDEAIELTRIGLDERGT